MSTPFDLLDAGMRDPFLQQAFTLLDQRQRYGIIPQVCRSWHLLSTTSTSMTVKVSADLKTARRQPDAAISYSEWLQRNIANITSLDLSLKGPFDISMAACLPLVDILRTISTATQLCDLQLNFKDTDDDDDDDVWSGVELPESFTGLAALTDLTTLGIHNGDLSASALSTISVLTHLRALDLTCVHLHEGDANEEGQKILPQLLSSLGNLTHLTLNSMWDWNLVKCVPSLRSLSHLVGLDMRKQGSFIYACSIHHFQGLPITGMWILLNRPEDGGALAHWLQHCIPTTLEWLTISSPPFRELQPSQAMCPAGWLAHLRSAGPQLRGLVLECVCLSEADVRMIEGLTQLTRLDLSSCKRLL